MTRARQRWLRAGVMLLAWVTTTATIGIASAPQPAPPGPTTPSGGGPLERIAVRPSRDVPAPRRTTHVSPDWPPGTGGRVRYRVHLVVGANGVVAEARIVAFSGPGDRKGDATAEMTAVLAAVRQWHFEPPVQAPMLLATYVGPGDDEGIVMPSPTERPPIRIGGGMRPPTKVHHASPEYPADARAAGISGVVIVEATIDPEGAVSDVRVVRSVSGLDEAAMEAVRQWRYTPTLLNGDPVPVIMTVTVNFQP